MIVFVALVHVIDNSDACAALERTSRRFAVDDFGLVDDGTVAIVGDRGLWSPHVAGVTAEASAAMDDVVVPGWCKRLPAGRCGEMQRVDPGVHGSVVGKDHGGRVGEGQGGQILLDSLHSVASAFQHDGGAVGKPVVE
jgi:hypothetical protein